MSVRSVPVSVLLAEECGSSVWICIGGEELSHGDASVDGQVEDQPSQAAVSEPQADSAIAQRSGLDGRIVLGDDSDVAVG